MPGKRIDLSIVFPVHNERPTIQSVLTEWDKALRRHSIKYELVVSEDGSTDGTSAFLKSLQHRMSLVLSQHENRLGYGKAVQAGVRAAHGTYVLCVDSDGQCSPKDFSKFWESRNKAPVVFGKRKFRKDAAQRKLFSFMFHLVFKTLFSSKLRDPSTPYMLCRKSLFLRYQKYFGYLREGFWWGFTATLSKKHVNVIELEVEHRNRKHGTTQVYNAKKIPGIAIRNIAGLVRLYLAP